MDDIHGSNRARPEPDQATPDPKYCIYSLFWHERASDRRYEALDSSIMKIFSSSIDLDGSRGRFIGLKGGF